MIGDKLKTFTSFFSGFFDKKKALSIIIVLGCIGIILIGASDLFLPQKSEKTNADIQEIDTKNYIEALEKKTQKMILSISGAGKSKIMITAESSSEKNFATDEELSSENKTNTSNTEQNAEQRSEIVIIESNNGKNALITRTIEPKIRGVLVLCEGADIPKVRENVTEAVKTVLGVPYNKICVIKLKV